MENKTIYGIILLPVGVVAAIVAAAAVPTMAGLSGLAVVGAGVGAAVTAGVLGYAGLCAGALVGIGAELLLPRKSAAMRDLRNSNMMPMCAIIGGAFGLGGGAYLSHLITKPMVDQVARITCQEPFNKAVAQKCQAMGLSIAPKGTPRAGPKN